jgi:hypothetical protein
VDEYIRRNAELVIEQMQSLLGVVLSYDEESVAWLDSYIARIRADLSPEETDKLVSVLGSFFGECIRRRFGGEWKLTEGRWSIEFGPGNAVFPFAKVGKHFQDDGESILGMYKTIPHVFREVLKREPAEVDASAAFLRMDDQQVQEIASLLDALRTREYLSRKFRFKGDAWYDIGNNRFSMEYHTLAGEEERRAREVRSRIEETLGAAGSIPAPDPQVLPAIRMKAEALPDPWTGEQNDFDEACFCARYPSWARFIPKLWRAFERWKDDPRFLREAPRFMPVDPSWKP